MSTLFEPIPDYGDKFSLSDFLGLVKDGFVSDDDGHGSLATDTQVSNINISPSMVSNYDFPEWCTHIMWWNK